MKNSVKHCGGGGGGKSGQKSTGGRTISEGLVGTGIYR